jgi:hypothetical protein
MSLSFSALTNFVLALAVIMVSNKPMLAQQQVKQVQQANTPAHVTSVFDHVTAAVGSGHKFMIKSQKDEAFEAIVRALNIRGRYTVDAADSSKEAGTITTVPVITGRFSQTADYAVINIASLSKSTSLVRVSMYEQKRNTLLGGPGWTNPKVNDQATEAFLKMLQPATVVELERKLK